MLVPVHRCLAALCFERLLWEPKVLPLARQQSRVDRAKSSTRSQQTHACATNSCLAKESHAIAKSSSRRKFEIVHPSKEQIHYVIQKKKKKKKKKEKKKKKKKKKKQKTRAQHAVRVFSLQF